MNTNGNNYVILHTFTNSPDGELEPFKPSHPRQGWHALRDNCFWRQRLISIGGTLFKIDTNGGNYTILHELPTITVADGYNPSIDNSSIRWISVRHGVAQNNAGQFGNGMVFKSDTNGTNLHRNVAHSFTNSPPDGANPSLPLLESADGAFYGTADDNGGLYGQGIVFRLTPPLKLSYQSSSSHGTNTSILSLARLGQRLRNPHQPDAQHQHRLDTAPSAVTIGTKLFTTNKSTAPSAFFRLQTPP